MLLKFVTGCVLVAFGMIGYGLGGDMAETPDQFRARVAARYAQIHETTEAAGYNYSRYTDTKVPTVSIFDLDDYYGSPF